LLPKEIQSKKKECGPLPLQEGNVIYRFSKNVANRPNVDISEEVLNQLRRLNPRDVVNIFVN